MADNDFLSRSRDAGSDAVQKAQDALEQVLGQINRASDNLKTTSERLVESIDKELRAQVSIIRSDIEQLERRLVKLSGGPARAAKAPAAKAPAAKAPAKKTAAKKTAAKKTAAKKAPAKKAPAKKAPAKKAAAKKAAAKKSPATKTAAKKAPAKKSAASPPVTN